MKNPLKISTLFLFSIFLLSSCSKDDNNDATMKVVLKMNTTSTSTARMTNNSLVFNTGAVTIREIVFDGEKTSGGSVSITHEQISTINLATGVASPDVEIIIPIGEYNSVNLGIEIQDENDTPTVIAEGIYTDNDGIETPLKFEFNSGEVFEAEAPSHTFGADSYAIAEIDFSPAVWFSTITGTMLDNTDRVDGVILVNESTNSNIFDIVADKLDNATQATFN
ncbi:MAG: hypothetical protein L3J25_05140 [Flavobacteriaceae bacterium]|nr:hypothetical protein [Flavobacteriaceae bacterium]